MSSSTPVCAFCGKGEDTRGPLFGDAASAYICGGCLGLARQVVPPLDATTRTSPPDDPRAAGIRCGFCEQPLAAGRRVVAGPRIYICEECIRAGIADLSARDTHPPIS